MSVKAKRRKTKAFSSVEQMETIIKFFEMDILEPYDVKRIMNAIVKDSLILEEELEEELENIKRRKHLI